MGRRQGYVSVVFTPEQAEWLHRELCEMEEGMELEEERSRLLGVRERVRRAVETHRALEGGGSSG